ncbi:MAG: hypothetical protein JWO31_2638 [Phycisphaerales bacterium]|nr:hypothetical protein [Phycisphaerales bacterium]
MPSLANVIPDPPALLATIDAACTNVGSHLHGPAHWRAVGWTGLELLAGEPAADPAVVLLFAMFHDSMRLDDGYDPQHGPRAAVFAASLHGRHFHLPDDRLKWLTRAIRDHTAGRLAGNPTIACCWDADRLNLWRVGVRPDPAFLSTETARRPEVIERAAKLEGQRHGWDEIVRRHSELPPGDGDTKTAATPQS